MKKMTKMAVTLAAMTAMTVAAGSMALAAPDNGWDGSDRDGWYHYTDGIKDKSGWTQIDGVWYYFDRDGLMAQNELIYVDGETYYLNSTGAMMAGGWVGFDDDSEILDDYNDLWNDNIDIEYRKENIRNQVYKTKGDAYETVWLYFYSNGTAADDEWYQSDAGLWYYFDDIVMVCGDFDHEIKDNYYGFGENGEMLVGWAQNYVNKSIYVPTTSDTTWYYYDSNGKKFDVIGDNNGYGWKKIDGNWYYFKSEVDVAGKQANYTSCGTMISNTLFSNEANSNQELYYVDSKGVMATGATTVPKGAKVVLTGAVSTYHVWNGNNYAWDEGATTGTSGKTKLETLTNSKDWEFYFDTSEGKAKDGFVNNLYYAKKTADMNNLYSMYDDYTVMSYVNVDNTDVQNTAKKLNLTLLKGHLVKNAFVEDSYDLYYVDKYGEKVTNTAVQVGYVAVYVNTKTSTYNYAYGTSESTAADQFKIDFAATYGDTGYTVYKAFIVTNSKGVAYDDYDAEKTVTAGSKKYYSTELKSNTIDPVFSDEAYIFYYKNNN